jgi:hypothetical protein
MLDLVRPILGLGLFLLLNILTRSSPARSRKKKSYYCSFFLKRLLIVANTICYGLIV